MDVIRFDQVYPGWYFNPSRWDTADGYVPWRVFWLLYQEITRTVALHQLDRALEISLGVGLAMGKADEAQRLIDTFKRNAGLDA